MKTRLLYLNKHASPDSFREAMQAFILAGYRVAITPKQNRDGCATRLKKDEEIWIEWFTDDSLSISSLLDPSDNLRKEVFQVLSRAEIKEVRII